MANRKYTTIAGYVMCRTLGHAWDSIAAEHAGPHGGEPMWIRCERCNTVRQDEIHRGTGEMISRRYVYEDGYRHAFDNQFADALPTRNDFRLIYLSEAISEQRNRRVHPSNRTQPTQQRKSS